MPLAAQLRQVERATEPREEKLLREYRIINAELCRGTYGPSGPIAYELRVGGEWITILHASTLKVAAETALRQQTALARATSRLGRAIPTWDGASAEDRRILLMTQKEFNSLCAASGRQPQQPAAQGQPQEAVPAEQPQQCAAQEGQSQQ